MRSTGAIVGGAVGQRRDRLGAADAIDLRHAGAPRRGQHQRVQRAVRGGHAHGDARHAGDAGRDGVHQHRGRIGRLAARHVETDRIERRPAHAQRQAGLVRRHADRQAAARDGTPRCASRPGRALPSASGGMTATAASISAVGDAQPIRRSGQPVEACGVVEQRRITAGADVGDDGRDGLVRRAPWSRAPAEQGGEGGLEAGSAVRAGLMPGRARRESGRSRRRSPRAASSARCG